MTPQMDAHETDRRWRAVRSVLVWFAALVVASAASAKEWKSLRSLEVTYTYTIEVLAQTGTIRLWYQAPASYRAEVRGGLEDEAQEEVLAVGDADGMRVYFPEARLVAWTPAGAQASVPVDGLSLSGTSGPFVAFQEQFACLLEQAHSGLEGYHQLPDDVVAGRRCTVVELTADPPIPAQPRPKITATTWADQEYGLPLATEQVEEGRPTLSSRATEVRINPPLAKELFELSTPPDVTVFKGPFVPTDPSDLMLAQDPGSTGVDELPTLPGQQGPLVGLLPRCLPPGFSDLGTSLSSSSEEPGSTWYISIPYANRKTGGVIQFTQGTDEEVQRRGKPDREEQVTVRKLPGRALSYSKPYPHYALVWESAGVAYSLEGSEVTLGELREVAEGMEQVTAAPHTRPHDCR